MKTNDSNNYNNSKIKYKYIISSIIVILLFIILSSCSNNTNKSIEVKDKNNYGIEEKIEVKGEYILKTKNYENYTFLAKDGKVYSKYSNDNDYKLESNASWIQVNDDLLLITRYNDSHFYHLNKDKTKAYVIDSSKYLYEYDIL